MSSMRFRTFLIACLALCCTRSLGNSLKWEWTSEPMEDTFKGKGTFTASQLLDQKNVTAGASDYLWYMTEVVVNDTELWGKARLQVNTTGHIIHSFINGIWWGVQIGTVDKPGFLYEEYVSLKKGTNILSLLSITFGKSNCKRFPETKEAGIVGGPVKLFSNEKEDAILDLSKSTWSYKVGMNGIARKFYDPKTTNGVQWEKNNVSVGEPMTWYKTTFKTPEGTNPIVFDVADLLRGQAWVNGQSIGRYWPWLYSKDPSERFYEVPRSFLNNGVNTLVLFEELGVGSKGPFNVSVQTVPNGSKNFNKWDQGCSS
jgi:hypothetical protein